MQAPANYKTGFGLYRATLKALETLSGCKRGWWLRNALEHAEKGSSQKTEKIVR